MVRVKFGNRQAEIKSGLWVSSDPALVRELTSLPYEEHWPADYVPFPDLARARIAAKLLDGEIVETRVPAIDPAKVY